MTDINQPASQYFHPRPEMTPEHLEWYQRLEAAEVARLERALPPSDMMATIGHAASALNCYADLARFHHRRAILRGLEACRSTRAMDGVAKRADELTFDLKPSVANQCVFTAQDAAWLKAAFAKVERSRPFVLTTLEEDFRKTVRRRVTADDREGPEFKQLREFEHTPAMHAAWSAVITIADAIDRALSGHCDPKEARVIAAEEMASLHASFREWGQ